ncbi:MAG: hypothetical protein OZ923_01360 [Comamonadaceae bacterium]|nr:hypothetical protein [Burkholderiales bacterium]MEB2347246.1 hypothetical protein [Comamonadaceae bacterium]
MKHILMAVLAALPLAQPAIGAQTAPTWQVQISDRHALPLASSGGQTGFSAKWAFWGAQWKWADARTTFDDGSAGTGTYRLAGEVPDLGVHWMGTASTRQERSITYDLDMTARSALTDVIGGGMVFKFDLQTFGDLMGKPVLLPGNAGWQWGREGSDRFTMRFTPALPKVFFERNNPTEVRAYFYDGKIPAGGQRYAVTLTWSSNASWQAPLAERLGGPPPDTWPKDAIDVRTTPPDLLGSELKNTTQPRLGTSSGATAPRYWGTNITAYALFNTPREVVQQQAKRLAALGYNLVRLHHHDSPWVNPNIFGPRKTTLDTRTLSAESLDKLDWWIKCLKDEGIAVWLDLHVGRAVMAGDGIYAFDEIAKGKNAASMIGFNYVNVTMQQAMRRFNEAYVTHRNAYTGLAYKDDPAIVAMLVTNENDITHHFGNKLLPNKGVPLHNQLYMNAAKTFAEQHDLPTNKTWISWQPGPGKLFLNDLEERFDVDMIDDLRRLGVKQPLATTNIWGNNPLTSLPALTSGDLIDAHSYGGPGQLEKDPAWSANLGHWMAAAQVVGLPLTVSEWNAQPFPSYDRHTLPLLVAAMASHQGWQALMHFAYTQAPPREGGGPSNWHSYNDPSLLPMLSAAALMYRRGDVHEAKTTYVYDPGAEAFFDQATSAGNAPALRTAAEQGRLLIAMPSTPQLPWLKRRAPPAGATIIKDPSKSLLPAGAQEVTSDTGELTHNWAKGTYTISTARTQAAMGWIGGSTVHLPAVRLDLQTRNASVAVQSLDDAALGSSRNVLVSIGTRSQPQPGNKTPFLVEPLAGSIAVKAPAGLKAWRNGPFNQWMELPATYSDGSYRITFDGKLPVQWVALR